MEPPGDPLGTLEGSLETLLGSSFALLGTPWGPLWALEDPLETVLGPRLGHLEFILGDLWASWDHLEASWCVFDPSKLHFVSFLSHLA